MKTVYFILGMHRSGTSALSGVLNLLGLDLGTDLMEATEMNPKGYFENVLTYTINENIFQENNSSWDDYHFNVNDLSSAKKRTYQKQIEKLIETEFRYSEKFAIKDPRNCVLFPLWEAACQSLDIDIKVIIPYRNPMETTNSLRKRDHFSFEKSLILWSHHFLSAEFSSRQYPRLFVSFDDLLNKTSQTIDQLQAFIEIQNKSKGRKAIENFLDKKVKHNNSPYENFTIETPAYLQKLINLLKQKQFDDIATLDTIRNDFYYSLEMYHHKELLSVIAEAEKNTKKIEHSLLLEQQVKNLEVIADTGKLDQEYYTNKYSDLSSYKGDIREHYYLYGKNENRYPNKHCESSNIDTKNIIANDEVIYKKDRELKQKNNELSQSHQAIHELQKKHDNIVQEQLEKNQQITKLSNRNERLIKQLEELTELNKSVKHSLKNKDKQTQQQIQKEKLNAQEIIDGVKELNSELKSINIKQEKILSQKSFQLDERNELINKLEQQNDTLLKDQQNHINKLASFNQKFTDTLALIHSNNTLIEEKKGLIKKLQEKVIQLESRITDIKREQQAQQQLFDENAIVEQNTIMQLTLEKENLQKNHGLDIDKKDQVINELKKQQQQLEASLIADNDKINCIKQEHRNESESWRKELTEQKELIERLKNKNQRDEQQLERLNVAADHNAQKIIQLQKDNTSLSQFVELKKSEAKELNRSIDEVVEDLIHIKHSKSWKYTKPFRQLFKILKD